MTAVLPFADYVIGNETEALAWVETYRRETKSIPEIARLLVEVPKKNKKRLRTVIITQGSNPTISAVGIEDGDVEVHEHPVKKVPAERIKDTNGAG